MSSVPKRVTERLVAALKKFQPIVSASKARDDGEADTVMIITDMLDEVFGYDKYSELTAEHAIRGTLIVAEHRHLLSNSRGRVNSNINEMCKERYESGEH